MQTIELNFKGEKFTIPDTKAFAVGELVEDIASLSEVLSWSRNPRYHKMARCIGAMLRFAGARVTDEEVHREIIAAVANGQAEEVVGGVFMLVNVLMHGAPEAKSGGEEPAGKASAS